MDNGTIIRSERLSGLGVINGTSTKEFGNMSLSRDIDGKAKENRLKFFDALGVSPERSEIVFPRLLHSANVALVEASGQRRGIVSLDQASPELLDLKKFSGINPPADFIGNPQEGIDACVIRSEHLFIAMMPADCAPVSLYDPTTGHYGMIHAGVLGAFSRIVPNTVRCMAEWCGTKPGDLVCYIGPAIGPEVYRLKQSGLWEKVLKGKVDEEVAEGFDLKLFLRDQLLEMGAQSDNIEVSPLCTATNHELLFSNYSAKSVDEKQRQGRHMSVIGKK
jgi:YfiH family protein